MILRNATYDDWSILLKWRNHPLTVQHSVTQMEIDETEHQQWLLNRLKYGLFYIAEVDNIPIGTIRGDANSESIILSWTISADYQGRGNGTKLLESFIKKFDKNVPLLAFILQDNAASIKMARKNGFKQIESINGILCFEYLNGEDMSKKTDNDIINEIEEIRSKNNTHWMDAVRLCFELAPEQAREIFKAIRECDVRITELTKELADNE